jgi:hypothetical protein
MGQLVKDQLDLMVVGHAVQAVADEDHLQRRGPAGILEQA